jgi:hypothetical protein
MVMDDEAGDTRNDEWGAKRVRRDKLVTSGISHSEELLVLYDFDKASLS